MRRLNILILLIISSLFLQCSSNKWAKEIDWKDFSLSNLPDSTDFPSAHAVILLDEGKVDISGSGEIKLTVFERRRVIRILDRGGFSYADVVIPYSPNSSEIEMIQARTVSPDGQITVLDKNEIFDIDLYPKFIFYADQKAKKFTFPAVEPGSIVEYRFRKIIKNLTLYHSWNFQDFIPTKISRFSVTFPSSWKLNQKVYNIILEPDSFKTPSGFKSTYRWEVKDLAGIRREIAMPPVADVGAYLLFSPLGLNTWKSVANWYYDLSKDRVAAGSSIKNLLPKILKSASSPKEKLKILYEWVRDNIRYVAIAIGIGSFQPHFAEDVLQNRYGDCKDMATLLCAMAKQTDIKLYPALVCTRPNGTLDTSLATPFRFNHVITYALLPDSQVMWLDPTHKGCPFGTIPWYDQGAWALVIKGKDDFLLTQIPDSPYSQNSTLHNWNVDLQKDGNADVKGQLIFAGAPSTEIRRMLLPLNHTEQKRWFESFYARRGYSLLLNNLKFKGLYPVEDTLTVSFEMRIKNFAGINDRSFYLNPGALIQSELRELFRAPTRIYPIKFNFGFTKSLNLAIRFPSDFTFTDSLFTDSLSTRFGSVFLRASQNSNGELIIRAHYEQTSTSVAPEFYQQFQVFLDSSANLLGHPIVLKKSMFP